MTNQTKAIPKFANEAAERAYWESHDSTDHLDWSQAIKVEANARVCAIRRSKSLRASQR